MTRERNGCLLARLPCDERSTKWKAVGCRFRGVSLGHDLSSSWRRRDVRSNSRVSLVNLTCLPLMRAGSWSRLGICRSQTFTKLATSWCKTGWNRSQSTSPYWSSPPCGTHLASSRREHKSKTRQSHTRCSYDQGKVWQCSTSSQCRPSIAWHRIRTCSPCRLGKSRHQAGTSHRIALSAPRAHPSSWRRTGRRGRCTAFDNGTRVGSQSGTKLPWLSLRTRWIRWF